MSSNALLDHILVTEIREKGPLSLARYMDLCLYHPTEGFYMKNRPLGKEGAFITAPEISQVFGEMVGLWLVEKWITLGSPSSWSLIELGPGQGTLMQDLLRFTQAVPFFQEGVHIHLVEISPLLRKIQDSRLTFPRLSWISSIEEALSLSKGKPTFILANEFFDALPMHAYLSTPEGIRERSVDLVEDRFTYVLSPSGQGERRKAPLPLGYVYEECPLAQKILGKILAHLHHTTGASLIIDYGYRDSHGQDTFQALRAHQFVNPLEHRGEADLTAHVDFGSLLKLVSEQGVSPLYFGTQKDFLLAMGLEQRVASLKRTLSPLRHLQMDQDMDRLLKGMGTLFKVFSFMIESKAPSSMKCDTI